MVEATIVSVVQDRIVRTGEEFLNVTVEFTDPNGDLEMRKFAFDLNDSEEFIAAEIKKAAELMEMESAQSAENAERDESHANATETQKALEGMTISTQ